MNLGQFIGELMMAADGQAPARRHPSSHLGRRQRQVLAIVALKSVSASDLASEAGINVTSACSVLVKMFRQGLLIRAVEHGAYRYSKAKA